LCFILFQAENKDTLLYLYDRHEDGEYEYLSYSFIAFTKKFMTYLIGYCQIIPISLYLGMEIVKMMMSLFLKYDEEITFNGRPTSAKSADLIEELGQIQYIFSDKTGTLTKNEMIFRKCCIGNDVYGALESPAECIPNSICGDTSAYDVLMGDDCIEKENIDLFFTILSLCHSAQIEGDINKPESIVYKV
jgi:phospholipid-translocating ATPase